MTFASDDVPITELAAAAPRKRGLTVEGPTDADILPDDMRHHVAYLVTYHDQGDLPVRILTERTAAAITIGANAPFPTLATGLACTVAWQGSADRALCLPLSDCSPLTAQKGH